MPSISIYVLAAILAVPLIAAQGPPAGAPEGASDKQGDESMNDYPQWYSNDYDCVINCMQVFNGVTSRERISTLDLSWITCVIKDCDPNYRPQNFFQGNYIANMWYDTGSIYECDGAPCKPANATPSSSSDPASTSGTDQHTATSAVSMPGLPTSTSVKTETASSAGSTEPAATDTDGSSGDSSSGPVRASWSVSLTILAITLAGGALVVL